ncbi:MAG: SAM-dependent methyltransferase [Pseudomonadota bacterium]|nr:SAM-dependent methyltransferase [Pseudomonadota bacterium]MEE3098857.1 SAM-dependent methyltransferase [Pseudomonadota bacterium]
MSGPAAGEPPLLPLIRARIAQGGPMPLAEYMGLCLGHPRHGYYITRDPLGAAGDFTTAPEISQMFGELLGLWLAQAWIDLGRPVRVVLAEPGPGRGTLMADALRAAGRVPGFAEAARPHLVETSPALRARQAEKLAGRDPLWFDRLEDLPDDVPLLLVANEFVDALPIRQFVRAGGAWRERVVGMDGAGRLTLGLGAVAPWEGEGPEGAVVETCPAGEAAAAWIGARLARAGGAAVVIDYGYGRRPPQGGDTFQALRAHEYVDPLAEPGLADLTAHVDFGALARTAEAQGARAWPLATQGAFLERLGITARAQALARAAARTATAKGVAAPEDPVEAIVSAHRRLTHPAEMGELFKVLVLTGPAHPRPAGV